MDEVPEEIEQMRIEIEDEWYAGLPIKDIAPQYPSRFVKQYFLDELDAPDRIKTTTVLEIEGVGRNSSYRRGQIEQALNTVPGLHYTSSQSSMFVGWDAEAVKSGPRIQAKEIEAEEKAYSEERIALQEYVQEKSTERSPVETYLIDCEEIYGGWDEGEDLELCIRESVWDDIYEAQLQFNTISGVMFLAVDKAALDKHCASQLRRCRNRTLCLATTMTLTRRTTIKTTAMAVVRTMTSVEMKRISRTTPMATHSQHKTESVSVPARKNNPKKRPTSCS